MTSCKFVAYLRGSALAILDIEGITPWVVFARCWVLWIIVGSWKAVWTKTMIKEVMEFITIETSAAQNRVNVLTGCTRWNSTCWVRVDTLADVEIVVVAGWAIIITNIVIVIIRSSRNAILTKSFSCFNDFIVSQL